jgi:uncharacterized protein (DUF1810 family)
VLLSQPRLGKIGDVSLETKPSAVIEGARGMSFRTFSALAWNMFSWMEAPRRPSPADDTAQPLDLQRFLDAQSSSFAIAKRELMAGEKRSCWIWFIFPQVLTTRFSRNCKFYALHSLDDARAYLAHRVLGPRLVELVGIVLSHRDRPIDKIMGSAVDAEKLRSSLTLFALVSDKGSVFHTALSAFFNGKACAITLEKLGGSEDDTSLAQFDCGIDRNPIKDDV